MGRKTVTLTPVLERLVRKNQVIMIEKLDRDVSFTQALNQMLAWLLADDIEQDARLTDQEKSDFKKVLYEGIDALPIEAVLDQTMTDLVKNLTQPK